MKAWDVFLEGWHMVKQDEELLTRIQQRNAIESEDECQFCLETLTTIYSINMAKPKHGATDFEHFNDLVHLVKAYDTRPLYVIQWTNVTATIKTFTDYDEAVKFAYCDHLLKILPLI